MKTENPNAFKLWISPKLVEQYAQGLTHVHPGFDARAFRALKRELGPLELRDRVRLLARGFHNHLGSDFPKALRSLLQGAREQKLEGFALWPLTEFIQIYGLEHFDASMAALYELTQKFTAEFAVRPFIIRDEERTLAQLAKWVADPNEHVRRWVSEGTRPRLPWGERLASFVKDPGPSLAILEHLRFDSALYVRKSVANHLNDVAKDHPDQVVTTLQRWGREVPAGYEKHFQFILTQALRTLIKAGHVPALRLLGIQDAGKSLVVECFKLAPKRIALGSKVEFRFELKNVSRSTVRYLVDYAVHHRKADGRLSPKVFKGKSGTLAAGKSVVIQKRHALKPITTRRYYPGLHRLEVYLNGTSVAQGAFHLD